MVGLRALVLTAVLAALQVAHTPPFAAQTGVLNRESPQQRRRAKLIPARADLMGSIVKSRAASMIR